VLVGATPGELLVAATVGGAVAGAELVVTPAVGAVATVVVDEVEPTVDVEPPVEDEPAVDSGAVAAGATRWAVIGGAALGRDALHAARESTAAPATRRWAHVRRRVLNMAHHDGGHRAEIQVALAPGAICVSARPDVTGRGRLGRRGRCRRR
jgi:hypothetical protein